MNFQRFFINLISRESDCCCCWCWELFFSLKLFISTVLVLMWMLIPTVIIMKLYRFAFLLVSSRLLPFLYFLSEHHKCVCYRCEYSSHYWGNLGENLRWNDDDLFTPHSLVSFGVNGKARRKDLFFSFPIQLKTKLMMAASEEHCFKFQLKTHIVSHDGAFSGNEAYAQRELLPSFSNQNSNEFFFFILTKKAV